MEIGRNVLAVLPDGRRFEDAAETDISNKISEKAANPNFDRLFARLVPRAKTVHKQT